MTRRRSSSHITKKPLPTSAPRDERLKAVPPAPPQKPSPGGKRWVLAAVAAVLLGAGVWAVLARNAEQPQVLCDRFVKLRNANDPGADALLGRSPAVPDDAVSPEEAERLQADWFLREPIEILSVAPDPGPRSGPARFVLVVRGNVAAPAVQERRPTGVVRNQRTMSNPDITVEVRGGKIYGVKADLHVGP